ncbi:MAG: anthrone oxygenase family protein, partial [Chloroflexota bacterium]
SLFVGIIAAMLGVIQRVLNQLDYATYTRIMQGIIVAGRTAPIIWILLLLPVGSAGLALFLLRDSVSGSVFIWMVLGLVLFVVGPILVSRFGNEPWYDKIMSWSAEQVVSDWERERMQWFKLNVARFVVGASACIAFAMALANYHSWK